MKRIYIIVLSLVLLVLGPGCPGKSNKIHGTESRIMIAGSTSVQPIAEKLAEHYAKICPEVKIEIQGGGSSSGIRAAKSGAADIGTSSRELKPDEKDLIETVIAYDAVVLIAHSSNPVDNISIQDTRSIFSGTITDWSQLKKEKRGKITVITREEGSGTRGSFEELVMHNTEIADRCLVQDSTGAVREIVARDPNAIGYISFGALNSRVKALALDGIYPAMENMLTPDKNKRYKIIRPFLFVTKEAPSGISLNFIKYIKSKEGSSILKQEGLIPTND